MRPWLVGLLLMALAMPAIAADEGQIEASCVSIAEAQRQDAKQAAALHLTVYELNAAEVASFNAFMGDRFNASVDIVTLFVFPNGASEYVIGSVEQDQMRVRVIRARGRRNCAASQGSGALGSKPT
jgi:hypothetical protein